MTRRPIASPATHIVIWQTRALTDLEGIHDFIAQDAPGPALRTRNALQAAAQALEFFPQRGRRRGRAYVITVADRYLLRYRIQEQRVIVLEVRDGRRR